MKILIAGLAKTGTTGLLYLVASSIGDTPRLLMEPRACPADLDSGGGNVVAKILIKPEVNAASFSHFGRKITLVRDPRDRIISGLLYSQYHAAYLWDDEPVSVVRDILERKEATPSSVSIREILEVMTQVASKAKKRANLSQEIARQALTQHAWFDDYVRTVPDALLYKYEDFVSGEYQLLEKYLGIPMSGVAEVPPSVERVTRTKSSGGWRHWFTEEDVRDHQPALSPWLEKYGYDAEDWTLSGEPSIPPEHCSGYFMRLVAEQRDGQSRRAKIMRAEPMSVAGWAVGADPRRPIRVALLVNGNEVAREVADKPRPALKERGVHPTGICGFAFQFEPGTALQVGDQVSLKPVDAGFELKHVARVVVAPPKKQ